MKNFVLRGIIKGHDASHVETVNALCSHTTCHHQHAKHRRDPHCLLPSKPYIQANRGGGRESDRGVTGVNVVAFFQSRFGLSPFVVLVSFQSAKFVNTAKINVICYTEKQQSHPTLP